MPYLYFAIGFLLGAVLVGVWAARRGAQFAVREAEFQSLATESAQLAAAQKFLEKQLEDGQRTLESLRSELLEAQKKLGGLEAEKVLLLTQMQTQSQEWQKNQTQLKEQFENLAQKIFEEKSQKFTDQNLMGLKQLIEPFKAQIKDFEKRVEDTYSNERVERGTLKGEISKLIELNQRMSSETENLTRALKGDIKTQGTWGEFVLESVLERSGLREGEEYILQGSGLGLKAEDGGHLKPDVVVKLPDEKFLIVDSKVSLKAFEAYINAENSEEQERLAKEHVDSLKRHIDGLSEKKYHGLEELGSPDLTILFMPLEPAFALAFRLRPELLQLAWDKQIAIVSPTTLLTTLRTVASLWKQQRQNKNTLEIARAGGALYDKFVGLLDGIEQVGSRIRQTQDAYDEVLSRMSTGKGNLLRQVERLKELGAKTEKQLDSKNLGRQLLSDQGE
ncbi:MAG: recombination protein rmuC [Pseudomonadota bacterium]